MSSQSLGTAGAPNADAQNLAAYFSSLIAPSLGAISNVPYGSNTVISNIQVTGSYIVTSATAGWSTTYSATGLPAGVSINTSTGLISGTTPTVATQTAYTVSVTATNHGGGGTFNSSAATFTITVNPPAPVFTSATTKACVALAACSYSLTANYATTGFTSFAAVTGLPPGMTQSGATANTLSGTITTAAIGSPYAVAVSATNVTGTTNGTVTFYIAPEITNATLTATGTVNTAFTTYNVTASNTAAGNGTVTFSASNLPPGLSINTSSGAITGTVGAGATASPYTVTIGASSVNGGAGNTKSLVITIAPEVTNATLTAAALVGTAYSTGVPAYTVTANNAPTGFSATGLPAGLSIDASGKITGTTTATPGVYSVTISASNAAGAGSVKTLTLTLYGITSATTANGTAQAYPNFYTITANNSPTSYSVTGAPTLPTGLTLNTGTGVISGTPTATGTTTVTVNAINASLGTASQQLTITISAAAPVITSTTTASGTAGQNYSYQITASNLPTAYTATGLPGGLSVSPTTGLISGSPSQQGVFSVTLGASNISGANSATLTLTIDTVTPVISSSTAQLNLPTGTAMTPYQIAATNFPSLGCTSTTPPAGLATSAGGLISGTPTGPLGLTNVTISCSNATNAGVTHTGSATLPINVTLGAPVVSGLSNLSGTGGQAFTSQINASNTAPLANSVTYGITSGALPGGLSLNATTGAITGTPVATGSFPVTFSVNNGTAPNGSYSTTITFGLPVAVPAITSSSTATGSGGAAFSFPIIASNVPTGYAATGLPAGLSINTSTGLISGTPGVNGTFTVSVTASNGIGTSPAQTLTISLSPTAPTVLATASTTGTAGGVFSYQVTAGYLPTSYSATGLPAGLSINPTTGLITGKSTVSGVFNATVSVSNSAGSASQTLTVTLNVVAPVISSANTAGGVVSSAFTYQITAGNLPSSYGSTGLPAGLSVDTATGLISGKPTTAGSYNATVTATNSAGTGSMALTITVALQPPAVSAAAMTVKLNTAGTFDLAPYITGSAISGVKVSVAPLHGSVSENGTRVTYTPNHDYFGTDTFAYVAYGVAGTSPSSAIVTVTITGRPDPLKDTRVTSLVNIEAAAIKRFGMVQVFNFQQRLESRHHAVGSSSPMTATAATGGAPAPVGGATSSGQGRGYFNSWQPGTMLSYENDPNVLIHSAQLSGNGQAAGSDPVYGVLMNVMAGALTNYSLNLGTISNAVNALPNDEFGRVEVWAAGNLRFGTRSQSGVDSKFTTDGISVGADKRIDRKLMLGMGMGYARDKSDIGSDGTNSNATGSSVAGYASYIMDSGNFLDVLLGYGKVKFDTNRYVTAVNDFARASRSGDQLFGSVAFGYEFRRESLLWSPYGRYDFSYNRLNVGTENGAGVNALSYASQNLRSSHLAFGMRAQSVHQTDFGVVQPHARFEYQRGFESNGQTSVAYADMLETQYIVAGTSQNTNAVVLGLGNTFVMSDTLRLTFDYQRLRSSGFENYQSINLRLTKTIKGKNDLASLLEEGYDASIGKATGWMVIAGLAYDDNVSRASEKTDKLSDTIYSMTVSKAFSFLPTKFTRLTVSGFMDVEKFRNYAGLGRVSAGAQGEYAYRFSGDFGSPAISIFARFTADAYESELRDGSRRSVGVNLRKALTDRINIFMAGADNVRTGKSDVFNTRDKSGRMNLDYALATGQTLYLTGEYRKGDIVSSGQPSLQILDSSIVFVRDDVFTAPWFYDYRMTGKTSLITLGYNFALGTRDSLDFAWRRVKSTPDKVPTFAAPIKYIDNLFSVSYLMAF